MILLASLASELDMWRSNFFSGPDAELRNRLPPWTTGNLWQQFDQLRHLVAEGDEHLNRLVRSGQAMQALHGLDITRRLVREYLAEWQRTVDAEVARLRPKEEAPPLPVESPPPPPPADDPDRSVIEAIKAGWKK